jgi:hypothetical protein
MTKIFGQLYRWKKRYWEGRIKITHVESHVVDKKKDEDGNKRIPTLIQQTNIYHGI